MTQKGQETSKIQLIKRKRIIILIRIHMKSKHPVTYREFEKKEKALNGQKPIESIYLVI